MSSASFSTSLAGFLGGEAAASSAPLQSRPSRCFRPRRKLLRHRLCRHPRQGCRRCPGSGIMLPPLAISWQTIGQANPRQSIINPSVVGRRHHRGLVEAANSDIDLFRVPIRHECQRCAAMRAERPPPACPNQLPRLDGGEPKLASVERCPSHEWCAAAPAAIQTVAVSDIVRRPGRLITHRAAQTTTANCLWVHGYEIWGRVTAKTFC